VRIIIIIKKQYKVYIILSKLQDIFLTINIQWLVMGAHIQPNILWGDGEHRSEGRSRQCVATGEQLL
jgi:hypothetical protein